MRIVKSHLDLLEGKRKGKRAAMAWLAREPDATTMLANDRVTDGEARSQTLNMRTVLGPHPVEAVKQSGVVFLGDAGTPRSPPPVLRCSPPGARPPRPLLCLVDYT